VILDTPTECPRCGKRTSLVDEVVCNGKVVLRLCSLCSVKPLDALLVQFRRLVVGISGAVDKHCSKCSGQGWEAMSGGSGPRVRRCQACACTGVDMQALLAVLEIDEKSKPLKREQTGFAPGVSARDKSHKGER
jgi:hypothetical protein